MRIFYSAIFIVLVLSLPICVIAQEKPLTQAEYVQLLYDLQKNPQKKDQVVETVRKRGIAFVVTDGLRELTLSKSRSDEMLKRTLEEANRRRENPAAAQLPSEKESADVLAKAREATLRASEEMPDFIVKQVVLRSEAFAGTNKFSPLDRLLVAVGYRASGYEEYRLLTVNGIPQQDTEKNRNSYREAGGATSTGEFVNALKTIFNEESEAKFEPFDTDLIKGRRTIVYTFGILKGKAEQGITYYGDPVRQTTIGLKGRLWIDRENFRVLRLESQATEIPVGFPVTALTRNIDYEWVTINNQKYLLPWVSEVRMTSKDRRELIENRNEIRFREYRKFDVDIKILDDDEPVEEEKPAEKPLEKKP